MIEYKPCSCEDATPLQLGQEAYICHYCGGVTPFRPHKCELCGRKATSVEFDLDDKGHPIESNPFYLCDDCPPDTVVESDRMGKYALVMSAAALGLAIAGFLKLWG